MSCQAAAVIYATQVFEKVYSAEGAVPFEPVFEPVLELLELRGPDRIRERFVRPMPFLFVETTRTLGAESGVSLAKTKLSGPAIQPIVNAFALRRIKIFRLH